MKNLNVRPTALILCCIIATSAFAQSAPDKAPKRALVIGNSAYKPLPVLKIAAMSANEMGSVLKELGFETQVRLDLTQKGFVDETTAFVKSVKSGDIVIFYYSGYGMQADDTNWLVPVDFDPKSSLPINQRAYQLQRLSRDLDSKQAASKILVIDASRECTGLPTDGLASMDASLGTLIAFAARPGETARDPAGSPPTGLFTGALMAALKTPGLTPVRVFEKVQNDVSSASERKEIPYFVSLAVGDFYFVPPPPAPPPPKLPTTSEMIPGTPHENPKDLLQYVWIPNGTFKMGCVPADKNCAADEKPQHSVTLSKGFWMTETEVTLGAYERFTKATGHAPPQKTKTNPKGMLTDHPVTGVSWQDAADYCKWASGRLPTEAEWEYAARGGTADQIYPWGNDFDPAKVRYFKSKPDRRFPETVPVRTYPPNSWHLFEMIGNAREWTGDVYNPGAYNGSAPAVDPHVQSGGKEVVIRGGSYGYDVKDLRTSARGHREPAKEVTNQTGFRCVLPELH